MGGFTDIRCTNIFTNIRTDVRSINGFTVVRCTSDFTDVKYMNGFPVVW